MRILLVTPLYPPDIAGPSAYVKELAVRLGGIHEIRILTYGHIPETVPGVSIRAVEKSLPLPIRLFNFFVALIQETLRTDYIYIQNGPSVELPMILISYLSRKPFFLRLGDSVSVSHSLNTPILKKILTTTLARAHGVIVHNAEDRRFLKSQRVDSLYEIERPDVRPEILPLETFPTEKIRLYDVSWNNHITKLISIFNNEYR